ncbi:MAG: hypothetical protein IJU65_09925 [Desulfovibrio sp.]|nr:hypothetical protein [Desulfovibrio sp.]
MTADTAHKYIPITSPAIRRGAALAVWAALLLLFLLLGIWNIHEDRQEAENHLSSEAGHTAAQLANLLSLPAWELDEITARTIVLAAMEDQSIYAIKVQGPQGLLEGQRRNYQWEPVPWDDEIMEHSVQGMNPLKLEGHPVGTVEVYLSPRLTNEDLAQKARREVIRFSLCALACTMVLLTLLWAWGDLALLWHFLQKHLLKTEMMANTDSGSEDLDATVPVVTADLFSSSREPVPPAPYLREDVAAGAIISAELGRAFLLRRPDAWRITAGLFGQTFAHAPYLLARLYETNDATNLCRLGYILERAAPCVGAERLCAAAHAMQAALNDAECTTVALTVEECAVTLQEVLDALAPSGKGN